MTGIYVLRNTINNKMYVGQSIHLERRVRAHKYPQMKSAIDNAFRKYGWDNFEKHIFYVPEDMLDYFEIEMIKKLNTQVPNGYNIHSGGINHKGYHNYKETNLKIGESKLGKKRKPFSKEWLNNLSKARKGKKQSKEHIKNRFKNHKGNKPIICLETGIKYNTMVEAQKELNINHISCVIAGRRKSAGGFHWQLV